MRIPFTWGVRRRCGAPPENVRRAAQGASPRWLAESLREDEWRLHFYAFLSCNTRWQEKCEWDRRSVATGFDAFSHAAALPVRRRRRRGRSLPTEFCDFSPVCMQFHEWQIHLCGLGLAEGLRNQSDSRPCFYGVSTFCPKKSSEFVLFLTHDHLQQLTFQACKISY